MHDLDKYHYIVAIVVLNIMTYGWRMVNTYLNHGMHIALRSGELGGVLDPHQHHEVEVVPHVVLALYVFLERDRLVVKG